MTVWERAQKVISQGGSELKTWPATARGFRSGFGDKPEPHAAFRSAGVGQPFKGISDFQLPIAN